MRKFSFLSALLFSALAVTSCGSGGPDTRDTDSPFAMLDFMHWSHEWNKNHYKSIEEVERTVSLMKDAGVGMVRMDFLWADIEPEKGTFDFKKYDQIVGLLAKYDIKILGLLNYNPSWNGKEWNAAPDIELFTTYARQTVKHYKKHVKYWELWNEPDDRLYWQPQDYMKTYTQLLKSVATAIRKEDPSAKIVLGGIAKFIPQSLKHVYENGGKDYFDVVNAHPFQDPRMPGAMNGLRGAHKGLRKVMAQFGDSEKEIWFTELGSPGVKPGTKSYRGWWLGPNPTEEQQARWLEKVYRQALTWPGVKKVFWAFFRDLDGFFDSGVNDFGMVRHDFSPKPSYLSYQALTKEYFTPKNPDGTEAVAASVTK